MPLILIPLVLLLVLAGAWLVWRARSAAARPTGAAATRALRIPAPAARQAAGTLASTATAATAANAATANSAPEAVALPPEPLASLRWQLAEALPDERRLALVAAVGRMPRPPSALHQMLSPPFLERANSQALSELISGEARIAAKVLANGPINVAASPLARLKNTR